MYLSGGVHLGSMQSMDPCGSRPTGLPTAREICVPPAPPQVSKGDYHRGMTNGRPSRGQPGDEHAPPMGAATCADWRALESFGIAARGVWRGCASRGEA
jgi:hypothetical protein